MARARSKKMKDEQRRLAYQREQWKRRQLYSRSIWEPLERETVLMENVVIGPNKEDIHDEGEVLRDKHNHGSLQLAELEVKQNE